MSFPQWLVAVYVLENGKPWSYLNHEVMISVTKDDYPYQVWQKSAQVGATAVMIGRAIHWAEQGQRVIYFLPNDNFVSPHVKFRVQKLLEYSGYLNDIVASNAVAAIGVGKGILYNRGLQSTMAVHSTPADKVINDEIDRADQLQAELAKERVEHSDTPGIVYLSTPTIPNYGISRLYDDESDCREWMLKCASCGEYSALNWLGGVVRKEGDYQYALLDTGWEKDGGLESGRDIEIYCTNCGNPLNRFSGGEWVAKYERKKYHGYRFSRLMFPRHTIAAIYDKFTKAVGNDGLMTVFAGSWLGLPFAAEGAKLTLHELDAVRRDYMPVDTFEEPVVLGADIGPGTGHHYIVYEPRKQRVLEVGLTMWEGLWDLYKRYKIKASVIDARPETSKVKDLQKEHGGVYLAEYPTTEGLTYIEPYEKNEVTPDGREEAVQLLRINRTGSLDKVIQYVRFRQISLPKNARSIGKRVRGKDYGMFYEQMMNSVRTYEQRGRTTPGREGVSEKPVAVYKRTGPDHWLHALNYALAAAALTPAHNEPCLAPYVRNEEYENTGGSDGPALGGW